MTNPQKPRIIGFVTNLMFTTRIESIISKAGFQVEWADPNINNGRILWEPILKFKLSMIIIDIGIEGPSWGSWISSIKSDSKTEDIPIVCFGSHKDVDSFKKAKRAGSDMVVARSRFFSSLPDILTKYSNID